MDGLRLMARAIGYQVRNNITPEQVSLAVVVQELAPAKAAGVMFTADALTGIRDRLVINAARGLGKRLSGGRSEPIFFSYIFICPSAPACRLLPPTTLPPPSRNSVPAPCMVIRLPHRSPAPASTIQSPSPFLPVDKKPSPYCGARALLRFDRQSPLQS